MINRSGTSIKTSGDISTLTYTSSKRVRESITKSLRKGCGTHKTKLNAIKLGLIDQSIHDLNPKKTWENIKKIELGVLVDRKR